MTSANGRNWWLVTDTHLGHDMLVKEGHRPEGYEQQLLDNLVLMTRPSDVVIHFGDVSFYRDDEWHRKFAAATPSCKRWLARGNHDKKTNGWYLDRGWDCVAESFTLEIYGLRIAISHKPITAHSDFDLNIHGHLHDNEHHPFEGKTEKHQLIYMEHSYAPISLRKLVRR